MIILFTKPWSVGEKSTRIKGLMELRIVHTDDVHVSWKETPGIGDCCGKDEELPSGDLMPHDAGLSH